MVQIANCSDFKGYVTINKSIFRKKYLPKSITGLLFQNHHLIHTGSENIPDFRANFKNL